METCYILKLPSLLLSLLPWTTCDPPPFDGFDNLFFCTPGDTKIQPKSFHTAGVQILALLITGPGIWRKPVLFLHMECGGTSLHRIAMVNTVVQPTVYSA